MEFNIRVYGLLITNNNELLVTDELIRGSKITKFPGGGLELGEGTIDCLKREFLEECNLPITVVSHFYTTDFYQPSAFNPNQQIISIYYKVKALAPFGFEVQSTPFCFNSVKLLEYETTKEIEVFRLIKLDTLTPEMVTLPIDKVVVEMLIGKIK
jgi:8-oxo-dGTP diphosphatase